MERVIAATVKCFASLSSFHTNSSVAVENSLVAFELALFVMLLAVSDEVAY
jgi:hypothetical protein